MAAILYVEQNARAAIPTPCFSRRMQIGHPYNSKPVEILYGKNGFRICRWCDREVPNSRRTFCRDDRCLHEFQLRTSAGYVRQHVFARDRGICSKCSFDTETARAEIRRARPQYQSGLSMKKWLKQQREGMEAETRAARKYIALGYPSIASHWWEAHHVLPVIEGGGLCGLEGYETVCVPCHKRETADLARRRRRPLVRPPDLFDR